ncbi:hypothetical protein E3P89_02901 [Wallemia ichthyophaga]|uniref:Pre-mRNA-splicing factor CEF1 n=1 Tax=Wallemia ichthyophaga TaxID=245174 RepID=A0A4T0I0T6_WALIC|nr:hypothetical protein E3P90_02968 [Wallemia ichthyophaga]TIB10334.1 hypothetical protein E3P93_02901 [Wallemia ichthyophaga]TIB20992.1 hypothetical protein E3P89_02901 [Wallemia ichthyophaga]TIB22652.1 hypothetical protein E3P88_02913 [Wallemia ichthyophaga]
MRIIVKGGVWKNTEDEILKAAISKYGKNQWARISSLLVRKTPKQCKARWYEWLDPSIKKTEWSKLEDEKLLHLAKLMPTQWRTIAPIVGRTATQCLERYQQLLDEAERQENVDLGLSGPGDEAGPSDDMRKLKPGELDTDPESKPAKPDPIDMDEDEKEMLSEARARLANTQGKKAKRKARERQLEEARRLAVLQKRRELKAAGVISRIREKKKGVDYNADIPFEKQPAIGFYDVGEERAKTYDSSIGKSRMEAEGKRKSDKGDDDRRKKQKTSNKESNDKFQAAREAQIAKLKEADKISARRKLDLPTPQVGEKELEDIVKLGQAGESARELVEDGQGSTQGLLSDYDALGPVQNLRTPRTEQGEDNVMSEARNLRNMTASQTPLLGEENTPIHEQKGGTGYDSATPRHAPNFTPNPLATPSQVGPGATPLKTPIRDTLSINRTDGISEAFETPAERKLSEKSERARLKMGFKSLPTPQNNFEIEMPEDEVNEDGDSVAISRKEDAAERDARIAAAIVEEERKIASRRSSAIKLSLPRPINVDAAQLLGSLTLNEKTVDEMIENEYLRLVVHDAVYYPLPGSTPAKDVDEITQLPDEAVEAAKAAVNTELAASMGVPGANADAVKRSLLVSIEGQLDAIPAGEFAYSSSKKAVVSVNELSEVEKVKYYEARFNSIKERLTNDAIKTAKQEKKLGVKLGGYIARKDVLSKRLLDAFNANEIGSIEREAFGQLALNEREAAPIRVNRLEKEVSFMQQREAELQSRYKEMDMERHRREQIIEGLEEEEAERLNEIALADGVDSKPSRSIMKTNAVVISLALSTAAVEANWFDSKPHSLKDWNADQLQGWLKENKISFPDNANKDDLLRSVHKSWDTIANHQQRLLNDLKDETIDSWDESKIRQYLLENGVVAPSSNVEELRVLVKQLVTEVRSSASSASAQATAHAASAYDSSKEYAKDHIHFVQDYVLNELNDSKDFIYSTWNDNDLRSFLERKGVIRTNVQVKRDDLLKSMRHYYAAATDPVYAAWSDNYIRHWLQNNGVIKSKTAQTRDELLNLMKVCWDVKSGSPANPIQDNYYDAKSYVYNSWSDNQIRSWLIDNGYLMSREQKTRQELLDLIDKYFTTSRNTVISSWHTSDLRQWAIEHNLIKSDVQIKREDLEKLAHKKYDKLTQAASPYIAWTDARLRGWLRAHSPDMNAANKTRTELISEVRKRYSATQGYGESLKGTIMSYVDFGLHSIDHLYAYLTGTAQSLAERAQEKAEVLGKSADAASSSAASAASSASSLAAKASHSAKQEL